MNSPFDYWSKLMPDCCRWLASRRFWLVLTWLVALFGLGERFRHGRAMFANEEKYTVEQRRPTDGRGHLQIDFAGQWLMGRLIATGNGRSLYDRNVQWQIVRAGFPRENEPSYLRDGVFPYSRFPGVGPDDQTDHDAESVMSWTMGKDDPAWPQIGSAVSLLFLSQHPLVVATILPATYEVLTPELIGNVNRPTIGGPLYPPILGVLYSPLGLFEKPQDAYFVAQIIMVLAIAVAGKGVSDLSRGAIWWPVAIIVLLLFPGCRSSIDLCQNATLTTCIVIWGWALAARGRDVSGGAVLGLLAFKPIWAIAFLLAPILMRKWRMSGSMAAVGLLQIVLTLPFVGVHSWQNWIAVGNEASECYRVNQNWIELSRDLGGMVRRPLLDFKKPEAERANPTADRLAAIALVSVIGMTAVVTVTCGGRSPTGLGAGFLMLGCYLGCYRFMYYDALLATVGFAVLFADSSWARRPGDDWFRRCFRPFTTIAFVVLLLLLLCENVVTTWGIKGRISMEKFGEKDKPLGMNWEIGFRWAWDTALILGLWMWLGAKLVARKIAALV